MRTFLCICFVALAVAIGMAFLFGVASLTTSHPEGEFNITLTINTNMIHLPAAESVSASPRADDANLVDIKGKVIAVRPEKNEIVVSENVKNWTFLMARDAKVIINDQEGKLADVQTGDDATVSFQRQAQQLIASMVRCTRKGN